MLKVRSWGRVVIAGSVLAIPSLRPVETGAVPIGPRPGGGGKLTQLEPIVRSAEHHDTSIQLRRIEPIEQDRGGTKVLPTRPLVSGSDLGPAGRPEEALDRAVAVAQMPSPIQNFDGVGNVNGVLPPDTDGEVGPNHYVQMVNVSFAIYNKTGTLLFGPASINTLWSGFGGLCETTNRGDPIVLYDHLADRWMMSQFAFSTSDGDPVGPFYECIAVSQTPNPTGAWHRYAFLISNTKMNDYPKFGVWPDGYYMSVNQFVGNLWGGAGAVAFERDRMLQGLGADMVYFDIGASTLAFGGMLPADLDGTTLPPPGAPNPFVEFDDDAWGWPTDRLHLFEFHVDWTSPSSSTFSPSPAVINTAAFDSNMCNYNRNCIPQPDTPVRLDAISDRLMFRLQYRNLGTHQAMVVNHTVDTGGDVAAIRWYELRNTGSGWSINQQGTFAPGDGLHRWMGSIAMDGQGNMAIGYSTANGSAPGGYPSIRYVGRLAGDPAGTMPQGETTLIDGAGSQTHGASRWGDYSAMTVDADDGCTFWYTNEYYSSTSSSNWKTRIGSFRFPICTDAEPPLNPSLSSLSHAPSTWSSDATVDITFGAPLSADTDGFSFLFDTSPTTIADTTKDAEETAAGTTSPSLPDGTGNWFHIRSVDNVGNWSAVAHFGPFWIDAAAPTAFGLLSPPDGATVTTSSPTLSWQASSDTPSGLDEYRLFIDGTLNRDDIPPGSTSTTPSSPLANGAHTWGVRAVDNAGNVTDSLQRTMTVADAEPPLDPTVSSPSHQVNVPSTDTTIEIAFGGTLSPDTDGFSYLFDTSPSTLPDTTKEAEETATGATSPALAPGSSSWFHLRTRDLAGNWTSTVHLGPFPIHKGATTTTVKATVKRKIKVSGTLSPPHAGSAMQTALFRKKGRFRLVKKVSATIGADGRFAARFKVPDAARCRVTATWPGDADHLGSSATKTFRC